MPLDIEQLQEDPLAEGAYFPGDLLVSLLGGKAEFWLAKPGLRDQTRALAERAISLFPTMPDIASQTVTKPVTRAYRAYEEFQRRQAEATAWPPQRHRTQSWHQRSRRVDIASTVDR